MDEISLERFSDCFLFVYDKNQYEENRLQLTKLIYKINYINKAEDAINDLYSSYSEDCKDVLNEWNDNQIKLISFFEYYGLINENNDILRIKELYYNVTEDGFKLDSIHYFISTSIKYIHDVEKKDKYILDLYSILRNLLISYDKDKMKLIYN